MIIADKIIMLRKKSGWSQEELAERLNVSRQSVSKWESGLSVPDLNKVIAMSTLFGVSTDFLLKDEQEEISPSETRESDDAVQRTVTAEEANRYLLVNARHARRIALGVLLCILSPVLLVLLPAAADLGMWGLNETVGAAIGMAVLFLLVGCAVTLFVSSGLCLAEFSYLEKESISLAYGVAGIIEKRREEREGRYRLHLTVGILICIFSALPLILCALLGAKEFALIACTAGLLCACAIGVFLIVYSACIHAGFDKLLQRGDYTEENKKKQRATETVSTAYWCVVVALYLVVSYFSGAWHITWIIWPVAGCLWAAVYALLGTKKQ